MIEHFGAVTAALVLGSFAVGWSGTRVVLGYARRSGILDHPGVRRPHETPTPRGGGLAVAAVFVAVALVLAPLAGPDGVPVVVLAASGGAVTAVGWLEDTTGLPIVARLGVQTTAAAGFLLVVGWPEGVELFGATVPLDLLAFPVALLWMVWLTNLYNFMDGADGVAGSQAIVAGAGFGLWFAMAGAPAWAVLCWCLAAAAGGFLVWNWAPAKIFLGDAGSLTLGFAFGGLAVIGVTRYGIPWAAFALVLGLFIADATWTLLARMVRGEVWWSPHRSHFYQRALASGWSHRRVAGVVLLAGAGLAVVGSLEAARAGPRWLWGVSGLVLLLALAWRVRARERKAGSEDGAALAGGRGSVGSDLA